MKKLLAKCNYDLMNCTWAHAVNSRNTLIEVLQSDIHCIESDIMFNFEDGLTYMSHPPICKTDFQFLDYWNLCKNSDKVFKLDFKMIEAVDSCLEIIDKDDMHKVIVNADILETNNSLSKAVDYGKFIGSCINFKNIAMLSIGWTTTRRNDIGYKWSDVYNMRIILDKLKNSNEFQMITLPIDVHMLNLNSIPKLLWLMEQFPNQELSLTIWSYKDVPININCLMLIRKFLKKSSIFIDIPDLKNSEKNELLATPANSINFTSNIEIKSEGKMFFQSCHSFVVGDKTNVELLKIFDDKLEFFIVFSISDSIEVINADSLSECKLCFPLSSSTPSDQSQHILFRRESISYQRYITNELDEQKFLHKSLGEIVYFCSLYRDGSFCQLDISAVNGYNTTSLNLCAISRFSIAIERHIRISVKTNLIDCRFVVIDFLNEFSPRPAKLMEKDFV